MNQAIFSIKPEFVKPIISGEKTVEVRNRRVWLNDGTSVWVYATAPVSGIVANVVVESVIHDLPAEIWERFENEICVDREFFESYTANSISISALKIASVKERDNLMGLNEIRQSIENFRPPQFYFNLSADSKLFHILNGDPTTE